MRRVSAAAPHSLSPDPSHPSGVEPPSPPIPIPKGQGQGGGCHSLTSLLAVATKREQPFPK